MRCTGGRPWQTRGDTSERSRKVAVWAIDQKIGRLASRQHGVFSRSQAMERVEKVDLLDRAERLRDVLARLLACAA
jgi:hypothetical protein